MQKTSKIGAAIASTTFSDIGWNRCRGAPRLGSQPIKFFLGIILCGPIYIKGQLMGFLPYQQLQKILHLCPSSAIYG
jgi:hypothetical protein